MRDQPAGDLPRRTVFAGWLRPRLLRRHTRDRSATAIAQRSKYALRLLRWEWLPDVLEVLSSGPHQYRALLERVRDNNTHEVSTSANRRSIQESVLNRTLAKMREVALIDKDREPAFPYHTTYRITVAGRELLDALAPLTTWTERHGPSDGGTPQDGAPG